MSAKFLFVTTIPPRPGKVMITAGHYYKSRVSSLARYQYEKRYTLTTSFVDRSVIGLSSHRRNKAGRKPDKASINKQYAVRTSLFVLVLGQGAILGLTVLAMRTRTGSHI